MNIQQLHDKNLQKINIQKHTNTNLLIVFIFNVARTLPHSVLTIFLLYKGISIANIALFQICFMLPIFIFEIPSGILSDKIGRKPTYLLSLLFMIVGFCMIGMTDFIFAIFLGQFFYGVATALMSGTIEADLLIRYRTEIEESKQMESLRRLQVKGQWVTYIGMLIGGVGGSFLFEVLPDDFYAVPVSLFGLVLIVSTFFVPFLKHNHKAQSFKAQLSNFAKETKIVIGKKGILIAIILLGVAQFLTQPYFNNWQKIYFNKGIDVKFFGLIYGIFQVIGIITSLLFLKYRSNSPWLKIMLIVLTLTIALTTLLFLKSWAFALIFPLFLIPFDIFTSSLSLNLSLNFSKVHISTQTSVVSTLVRVFSVLSLLTNWLLLRFLHIDTSFIVSIGICTSLSCALILLNIFNATKKNEKSGKERK